MPNGYYKAEDKTQATFKIPNGLRYAIPGDKHVVVVDRVVRSPAGKADCRWALETAKNRIGGYPSRILRLLRTRIASSRSVHNFAAVGAAGDLHRPGRRRFSKACVDKPARLLYGARVSSGGPIGMISGTYTAERLSYVLPMVGIALLALAPRVRAQPENSNPFGVQSRAGAAERMIVLAVQQGISSLPPTSGQSFAYRFDPTVSTFVASTRMGPTSFRSPVGVGAGKFSLRFATSFFELDETFGPIDYRIVGENFADPPGFVTRFGLDANATVGLFNLAANYGLTERIELNFNLPIVVVHARASEIFLSPDPQSAAVGALPRNVSLDDAIDAGILSVVEREFSDIAVAGGRVVEFDNDARAGVGRISVGSKVLLLRSERVQVAFSPEFFFPSPSEEELAGSETAAILPRLVTQFPVTEALRIHVDVGYDADFERAELRRFTWNTGSSIALTQRPFGGGDEPSLTLDFGVGGSEFEEGVEWTPNRASFIDVNGDSASIRALGNNELGNTFVDFLGGIKVRLNDRAVISGGVNVPLNDEGFRADAVGTFALEYYF